jgi:hypothetical protein
MRTDVVMNQGKEGREFALGYDSGYSDGYRCGCEDCFAKGYDQGYEEAWRQAKES